MSTLWELVEHRAAATPDQPIVVDDAGGQVTAVQLRDRAEELAGALVGRGIGPGDVVSWILPSSVDAAVLIVALARLGVVQNPLVPIYGEKEIEFITAQAGTSVLITPGVFRGIDFSAIGRAVAERVGFQVLELDELDVVTGEALPPPPASDDEVRWLFYTSGTSADPKGVKHSDRTVIASGLALRGSGMRPGGRWGGAVPITHIGGSTMLALALDLGMALHFVRVFDPVRTCELLREWEVDVVAGVGALVSAMLDEQRGKSERAFPALRSLVAGGGPRLPGLHQRVRDELGAALGSSYGMTELPIATCTSPDDPVEALARGEGRPTPGVEIRIIGDDGKPVPAGEEGEVHARGPQLFHGYVDPALDEGALDADGFFCTGDVGYLAPEGDLVITGRLKDVIIRNAENLSVREIEDLLLQHPALADATVVGLPDPVTGEAVCAVVVFREGEIVDLASLRTFCAERGLMRQKHPERLEVVPQLPRNPMGKVLKQELRRTLLATR